ncbi:hypothetical protein UFOVP71_449 [uncultured Caudovirales phage]|uniref:Uncharacterized protein n=1 Tax=uncultured Caudovirales phage TaxID=2100421 RepID=A0A6J5TBB5_9CAUD|nr:hypothetical protein UFOVP71_449 [uncultured Caudovirales phage]
MLDVFFITMGEEGSEANWQRLLQFAPNAKRVDNVKGLYNVHKACAELSLTDNFYVVDADAWIVDGFKFMWEPDPNTLHWGIPETECVSVWASYNPVNKLEYGYGGVKLFPRKPFLEKRSWELDLSTTIGRSVISKEQVSCETRFNATPESAWIGAFRECAKLASLSMIKSRVRRAITKQNAELAELAEFTNAQEWDDNKKANYRKSRSVLIVDRYKVEQDIFSYWGEIEECSQRRLTWCITGWDKGNGQYAILGAQAGAKFGLQFSDDTKTMNLINDWDWLKKEFKNVNV